MADVIKTGSSAIYDSSWIAYNTGFGINPGIALANDRDVLALLPLIPDGSYSVSEFRTLLFQARDKVNPDTLPTPADIAQSENLMIPIEDILKDITTKEAPAIPNPETTLPSLTDLMAMPTYITTQTAPITTVATTENQNTAMPIQSAVIKTTSAKQSLFSDNRIKFALVAMIILIVLIAIWKK